MEGSFTFTVADERLNFDYISEKLGIFPTKIVKKGQLVGRTGIAPYDIWSLETRISEDDKLENALNRLLQKLNTSSEIVRDLNELYSKVIINCYLRSDYAQMGFELSNDILKKTVSLGIGIDFHILSFGGVEK